MSRLNWPGRVDLKSRAQFAAFIFNSRGEHPTDCYRGREFQIQCFRYRHDTATVARKHRATNKPLCFTATAREGPHPRRDSVFLHGFWGLSRASISSTKAPPA